jgi:peroxiredoxin
MYSRIHPFTSLGILLAVIALPVGMLLGVGPALVLLGLGFGVAALEFKKYTSNYQFGAMVTMATAMGIALDLHTGTWPWLTLALLLAATAGIIRQLMMHRFTYVNLLWVDTGASLVALAVFGWAIGGRPFDWSLWLPPLLPIGFAVGLTFSYVQDAQHMRKRTRFGYRVQVGMPAPDFDLPDQEGQRVQLSAYRGKHPVLLIFVRGDWCPGCHMMLRTYERNRQAFADRGIHVMAIGPDDIQVNQDMVKRIGVSYRMLSDHTQAVSSMYGVVYTNPVIELGIDYAEGIPLPASFLVDVDGVVRYVSRPDRVGEFLDPALILGVLEQLPSNPRPAWS